MDQELDEFEDIFNDEDMKSIFGGHEVLQKNARCRVFHITKIPKSIHRGSLIAALISMARSYGNIEDEELIESNNFIVYLRKTPDRIDLRGFNSCNDETYLKHLKTIKELQEKRKKR